VPLSSMLLPSMPLLNSLLNMPLPAFRCPSLPFA
jgi:hypothetical protein